MTQAQRLLAVFMQLGVTDKSLSLSIGNLANLSTANKASLVGALNELQTAVSSATGINDGAASAASTYSSTKIVTLINQAVDDLVAGAPNALNTLKELSDQLTADQSALNALLLAVGNRVRFDADQSTTLTGAQKRVARLNIAAFGVEEIGDPDTDFLAAYNAAKA